MTPAVPWVRRRLPALLAIAALSALGAAVVVALPLVNRPDRPPQAVPTTAPAPTTTVRPTPRLPLPASLDELADRCVDRPQRSGQYRYFVRRAGRSVPGRTPAFTPATEMWIPVDVSDEWLVRDTIRSGRPVPEEFRGPHGGGFLVAEGNWRAPTPDFYAALPRDPGQIHERAAALTREPHPELWILLDSATALPPPAGLRAALIRAMAADAGLVITYDVLTADNRPAMAVGFLSMNGPREERTDVLLDPGSCEVIGWMNAGITIYLNRHAVVDGIGQRP